MKLQDFKKSEHVASVLQSRGFGKAGLADHAMQYARVAATLRQHGVSAEEPATGIFIPGRIEVLGKHTDYAGGESLVCTVERGMHGLIVPRPEPVLEMIDLKKEAALSLPITPALPLNVGHWSNYPATVVRRVAQNFSGSWQGGIFAFENDLPKSSGMSSSSAFMIAVFWALAAVNRLSEHKDYQKDIHHDLDLAHYLGCIENGQTFRGLAGDQGVGTFGGSQDHTAILQAAAGTIRRFGFHPTRLLDTVHVPERLQFVIGVSGVHAKKTGAARGAYNRAVEQAQAVLHAWNTFTQRTDPTLAAIIQAPLFSQNKLHEALAAHPHKLFSQTDLQQRFAQFYAEYTVYIPQATEALKTEDWAAFGAVVDRSQKSAETQLKNQVPETIFLAKSARAAGALAASAFGAGFGGAVWALVDRATASAFIEQWRTAYQGAFPDAAKQAHFFTARPGPPAFYL